MYGLLKQNIQSWTVKNNNTCNYQKRNFARAAHFLLYISLSLFCTTTTWNFQKLSHVLWKKCRTCSWVFFFTSAHFHLSSHVLTAPTIFSCCSSNKISLFVLALCRPFSRWALLACRLLSFSLSFSFSMFQICGHDNKSKLNTLDNTDTEKISAFLFRLYWLFSCLCITRRG